MINNATTTDHGPNRCDDCGQEFFYAQNLHECPNPNLLLPTTTWAEECVAKVMGR